MCEERGDIARLSSPPARRPLLCEGGLPTHNVSSVSLPEPQTSMVFHPEVPAFQPRLQLYLQCIQRPKRLTRLPSHGISPLAVPHNTAPYTITTHLLLAALTAILGRESSSRSLWLCSNRRRSLSSFMVALLVRDDIVVMSGGCGLGSG